VTDVTTNVLKLFRNNNKNKPTQKIYIKDSQKQNGKLLLNIT